MKLDLDALEAEAKYNSSNYRHGTDYEQIWAEDAEKILALIDLVRKKDEALKFYVYGYSIYRNIDDRIEDGGKKASEALALTDKLDHSS
jgi:hypothetical protein